MKYSEISENDKYIIYLLYQSGEWTVEDIEDDTGIPLEGVYRVLEEIGLITSEENPFNDKEE